jgi:hypothetical protein
MFLIDSGKPRNTWTRTAETLPKFQRCTFGIETWSGSAKTSDKLGSNHGKWSCEELQRRHPTRSCLSWQVRPQTTLKYYRWIIDRWTVVWARWDFITVDALCVTRVVSQCSPLSSDGILASRNPSADFFKFIHSLWQNALNYQTSAT